METEERTRNAQLLENIQTQVTMIAETCGSLAQRQGETIAWLRKLDDGQRRLEDGQHKLEDGVHKLDDRVHKLEDGVHKLDDRVHNLEDGMHRLEDGQRRLEDRHDKLEDRHDVLLGRVDRMEIRFELKFNDLEVFARDAQQRLKRIETHLQPGGASSRSTHVSPRRKATRAGSSRSGKKS